MRVRLLAISIVSIFGVAAMPLKLQRVPGCTTPRLLSFEIVRSIPRDRVGFTEGLFFRNGLLYESSGGYGDSTLESIDPDSGTSRTLRTLPPDVFGEGIATDGFKIFELSWKEHRGFVWDFTGKKLGEFKYPFEGWGLTRNSRGQWIASDGSDTLHVFSDAPKLSDASDGWKETAEISVKNQTAPQKSLNELEAVGDSLYANVFQTNTILKIDEATGCVTATADLTALAVDANSDLAEDPEAVMNGIAYRPDTGTFFITGKNWQNFYEITFSATRGRAQLSS